MIIFCSDLDRTLVYSNKFVDIKNSDRCQIVTKNSEYPGFMTNYSLNLLRELKENKNFMFIPSTTRTQEQYETLLPMKDLSDYSIILNGARILDKDGKIDEMYDEMISKTLSGYYYYTCKIWNEIKRNSSVFKTINQNEYFIHGKFFDEYECRKFLTEEIDKDLFYYSIQGNKYYIFPQPVRKENALNYLINKIKSKNSEFETVDVTVAGDGDVDIGMFKYATKPSYFIINKQKGINLCDFELQRPEILRIIKGKGIDSPDAIFYDIRNYFKKGDEK